MLRQSISWPWDKGSRDGVFGSDFRPLFLRDLPDRFFLRLARHAWRNRRRLTPLRLLNMAVVHLQSVLKTEYVFGRPYRVKIEPTNICNTKCQLCPTGLGYTGLSKGIMTFDRFKAIVDQISRHTYYLDLSMWGDPLIAPDIYEMIAYADRKGLVTYLSSNLHAFSPKKGHPDRLVLSGLNSITCSLHGASQGTYETYQPGKRLDGVVDKIKAINEAKARHSRATPKVILNFVVFKHNQHEVRAFQRLADSLDCEARFSSPSLNLRFVDRDRNMAPRSLAPRERRERIQGLIDKWLPDDAGFVRVPYQDEANVPGGSSPYNGNKPVDCGWPWTDAVINWDGSVVTCCGVFDTESSMGNLLDTGFGRIWNSRRYRLARRSFKHPVGAGEGDPCRDCPGVMA